MDVLVFEPDRALRSLFEQFFELQPGVRVRTFATGGEISVALGEANYAPQVAVLDFQPREQEGTARAAAAIYEAHPDCLLFVLSDDISGANKALKGCAAVSDFVARPFSFENILQRIGLALETRSTAAQEYTLHPSPDRETVAELRARVEANPGNTTLRNVFAYTLYTANKFSDALEQYRTLHEAGFVSFFSLYYMGQTLARLGDKSAAVGCWSRALDLDLPDEVRDRVRLRISKIRRASGIFTGA